MRSALLALALSAGSAAGCADNDLSLSIVQMESVTAPACVAGNTIGVGLSRGVYDVAVTGGAARGYVGVPLVRNNQQPRMPGAGNVEFNAVQVIGANVQIDLPPGVSVPAADQQLLKYYYPAAAGRLDPSNLGPMFVELIPSKIAADLAGSIPTNGLLTVTVEIRPVGQEDNQQVIGGPIFFPIDLCKNCLRTSVGACPVPTTTMIVSGGCFFGQDVSATCCTETSGALTCPARTM
jgi:hypothetical protein